MSAFASAPHSLWNMPRILRRFSRICLDLFSAQVRCASDLPMESVPKQVLYSGVRTRLPALGWSVGGGITFTVQLRVCWWPLEIVMLFNWSISGLVCISSSPSKNTFLNVRLKHSFCMFFSLPGRPLLCDMQKSGAHQHLYDLKMRFDLHLKKRAYIIEIANSCAHFRLLRLLLLLPLPEECRRRVGGFSLSPACCCSSPCCWPCCSSAPKVSALTRVHYFLFLVWAG